ncbi:hypothetical protein ACEQ8H_000518 [Pleosporales sp. CAS-2024a]
MNDDLNLNPHAMPFRPGGNSNDARLWNGSRDANHPPPPHTPPFGHPGAPWHMGFPPPPPPPPFFSSNQFPLDDFDAHQQWAQHYGPLFPPQHFGHPPLFPPQHFPPPFPQQQQHPPPQPGYPHPAHFRPVQQPNWPNGATPEDMQYAFHALIKGLKSKRRGANSSDRAPTQSTKKSNKSKAKAKAAVNGHGPQGYGILHRVDAFGLSSSRIDQQHSESQHAKVQQKGRYGDAKIMLPAPQPTDLYLSQASEKPSVRDTPGKMLVILDLNGTLLYRPKKNPQTMIARPYLQPFLRYLFANFKVMVWSSARPVNVKALVEKALDQDLKSMLVATWARDTFGLSATNFALNVQVYKNLRLIWSRDQIQQHHPQYEAGERFGQHNTVLIDDSPIKASAQPHNLLEIPEFEATPEQMEGDVLREVAGYLETLRYQSDVSRFINKEPFRADGRWAYDWPADAPAGGHLKGKAPLKPKWQGGKGQTPLAATPRTPMSDVMSSLSTVSLNETRQAT